MPLRVQAEHRPVEKITELEGLKALVVDDDFNTCDSVTKMLVNKEQSCHQTVAQHLEDGSRTTGACPKFLEELRTLLKTDLKGKESIFFKILTTQLSNIKNFGSKIYTIDSNEILQGADGHYYSIHLQKSQFNVRLIVYNK